MLDQCVIKYLTVWQYLSLLQYYKKILEIWWSSHFSLTINTLELMQSCQGHLLRSRLMFTCLEDKLGYFFFLAATKSCQFHRTKRFFFKKIVFKSIGKSNRSCSSVFSLSLCLKKEKVSQKHPCLSLFTNQLTSWVVLLFVCLVAKLCPTLS